MALNTPVALEVAFGADLTLGPGSYTWTDATPYARAADKVTVTQGRRDGFSSTPPSTMKVRVDNAGGRWVARNLAGPWYGQIRRNVPIRMLADTANYVNVALDSFSRTSAALWGATDTGQGWTDSGAGGSVLSTDWTVSGGFGKHNISSTGAFRQSDLQMRPTLADVRVSVSVSCPVPTGAQLEPANIRLRRVDNSNVYLCRVQITVAAAVQIVIFRNTTAGGSVTLVGPVTVPGMTHSAGTPLNVEAETYGSTVRMRVWQGASKPTGYTVSVVDPAPIDQPGNVGVRSGVAFGNTNASPVVFSYDNLVVEQLPVRFEGFIDELPVSWDPTARDSTVLISASGLFRRMGQGTGPATSATLRALTSRSHPQPVQYWTMEDPAGSTTLASQVGAAPMSTSGLSPGSYGGVPGSLALPRFGTTGYATGPIPFVPGVTQWGMRCIIEIDATPSISSQVVVWSTTSGIRWLSILDTGDIMTFRAADNTNFTLGSLLVNWSSYYNRPQYVILNASQSGADISWSVQVFDILANTTFAPLTGTLTSKNVGWPMQATAGNSSNGFAGSVGHLAFYSDIAGGPYSGAFNAWLGQPATNQISGVCFDAGIPVSVSGVTDNGKIAILGYQAAMNTLALVQDAATVDGGILSERGFGVFYLSRFERYNRVIDMTLNHVQLKQIGALAPTDDDQASRNYEVVSRTGGSRGIASNPQHIAKYQLYDEQITLNLRYDQDTVFQAQWKVWVGTVDDIRVASLVLNLAATPALLTAWKQCWIGDRIQIVNPPKELGVPLLDLHIEGWTEVIDPGEGSWTVTLNLSSALPWQVFELEQTANNGSRADTDDSTLAGPITATAAGAAGTITVTTLADSPLWTQLAPDLPLDVNVDGERITVGNIASILTDAFTRSVSSGWGSADTGQAYTTSGGAAADYGVSGTRGTMAITTTGVERTAVIANIGPDVDVTIFMLPTVVATVQPFEQKIRIRHNGADFYETNVQYATSGVVSLYLVHGVTVLSALVSLPYNSGTTFGVRMQASGSLIRQKIWDAAGNQPAAWTASVTDANLPGNPTDNLMFISDRITGNTNSTLVVQWDNLAVVNPQVMTVVRGVNGTAIAHARGAKVSLWQPGVIAL